MYIECTWYFLFVFLIWTVLSLFWDFSGHTRILWDTKIGRKLQLGKQSTLIVMNYSIESGKWSAKSTSCLTFKIRARQQKCDLLGVCFFSHDINQVGTKLALRLLRL